jgi:hypothetical protein
MILIVYRIVKVLTVAVTDHVRSGNKNEIKIIISLSIMTRLHLFLPEECGSFIRAVSVIGGLR